jgi:adenylylsulfate kinase-like enzyme
VTRRHPSPQPELTLVIAGPPASGRSTVACIVSEALRAAGAEVMIVDDGDGPKHRIGPLTGKKIRVEVRPSVRPDGAPVLRIVK